jgi:sulfite reductase alpha subunit-like flavoprotein
MSAAFTEETGTTLDATLDNPKQVSTAETPSEPHLTWVSEAERKKKPPGVYRTADPTVIDIRNPHTSTIAAADQLHTNFSDRSAKHLSFDYSQVAGLGGTSYAPGDYLGVYPTNQDSLVEEIAQYLSLDLDAEFELTETGMKEVATKLPFFFPRPCSVRGALKYYCDLTKPPRRALISMMIKHANGADAERLAQLLAGVRLEYTELPFTLLTILFLGWYSIEQGGFRKSTQL